MRLSRDLVLLLGLFAILAGLMAVVARLKPPEQEPVPLSTHTVEPGGALALQMWLDRLGYRTSRIEGDSFSAPEEASAIWILRQVSPVDKRQADALMAWVARGNTLIVVDTVGPTPLLSALKEGPARVLRDIVDRVEIEQPLGGQTGPVTATVNARVGLNLERSDYVEYLSAQGLPLLVSFRQGEGRVWLASIDYVFTNRGLADEANALLVSALFRDLPRGSLVAFDEYHLAVHDDNEVQPDLKNMLFTTPVGWAILYLLILGMGYLIVNGQRLGRPAPLAQSLARRSPAEYVVSMAQLFRRAGKRPLVMRHYYQHLKRKLGRPYQINPEMPDDEFIATLARNDARVDTAALARLLQGLNQKRASENALVRLAHQAVKFTERRG